MRIIGSLPLTCIVFLLGACGGGSDGSNDIPNTVSVDAGLRYGPGIGLQRTHNPEQFLTSEFFRTGALAEIGADSLYSVGGTGLGKTVAVIDTGIETGLSEFQARLHPSSADVVDADGRAFEDGWSHGTMVAGLLGAARDGHGMHGVAFDSEILAIRADDIGSCPNRCSYRESDLAIATSYAVEAGADVLNFSLGAGGDIAEDYAASLAAAAAAGKVLVFAAGNYGEDHPTNPAMFATRQAANGQALIVGATDRNGNLAPFSNRAGSARAHYLVVPGVGLETTVPDGDYTLIDGTSFATPLVSGAAAALWSAAPHLTAAEIVEILLTTARDLGVPGVDSIYGWGMLDLAAAAAPQGDVVVPQGIDAASRGPSLADSIIIFNGMLGGSSLPNGVKSLVLDRYERPYSIDITNLAKLARTKLDIADWFGLSRSRHEDYEISQDRFALSSVTIGDHIEAIEWKGQFGSTKLSFYMDPSGHLHNGLRPSVTRDLFGLEKIVYPFSMPAPQLGVTLEQSMSPNWTLFAKSATNRDVFKRQQDDSLQSSTLIGTSLRTDDDRLIKWQSGVQIGNSGTLGLDGRGAFRQGGMLQTAFTEFTFEQPVVHDTIIFGSFAVGRSAAQEARRSKPVTLGANWAQSWSIGLAKKNMLTPDDRFLMAISQPLRAIDPEIQTHIPVSRSISGAINYATRKLKLKQSGHETRLELGYILNLGAKNLLSINTKLRHQPDHRADLDNEFFAGLTLLHTF